MRSTGATLRRGAADVDVGVSLGITLGLLIGLLVVVSWMFKTGYRLKQ